MQKDVHIVVNKHTPFVVEAFERIGKVTALDTRQITKDSVRDADILIVRSETKVNSDLLEGSRVKFVGTITIGTDHIDEQYLKKHGIQFVSAPGSNANSVGEYIIAALLELAKKLGFLLAGKTMGIVGVGNVGSNVWRKAEALGMRVLLNDPPLERKGSNYPLHSLDELMESDIITLHVPLTRSGTDSTYHLFNEQRIGKMKSGTVLINTSRGSVVETDALKNALLNRHLSAAVLDVWEGEPHIDISLLELVSLATPHIAGYSLDGKINALRIVYETVCKFLSRQAEQSIDALIPSSIVTEITIDKAQTSKEEIFRDIVKQCYDISADDILLRKIILLALEEREGYFSGLRANYRVRREFHNRTVSLPEQYRNIKKTIKLLGFNLKD